MRTVSFLICAAVMVLVGAMVYALLQTPDVPVVAERAAMPESVSTQPISEPVLLSDQAVESVLTDVAVDPADEDLDLQTQLNLLRIDNSEWDDYEKALSLLARWLKTDPDAALNWALNLVPNEETQQIQYEFLTQLSSVKPELVWANFELFPTSRFSKQLVRDLSVLHTKQSFQAAMDWVNTLPNPEWVSTGRWALYKNGLAESPLDIIDTVMIDDSLDSYRQQALLHRAFLAQLALDSDFADTPLGYYSDEIQPALISALIEHGETIEGLPIDQWLQTQAVSPKKDSALIALSIQGGSYPQQFAYIAGVSNSSLRTEHAVIVLKSWSASEPKLARQALDQSGLSQKEIDTIWARVSS